MPVAAPLAPLTGRDREVAQLVDEFRAARPDGVVRAVRGEPGIGKTTLVEHVAAGSGRRVLRVRGSASEAVLPFSVAADLLVGLRPLFWVLPAVQREALEVSLSLRSGPPGSPLTVCAAALGVLAVAADDVPLLVLVDDLPWVDPASRQLLLFVARRLHRERVAMLVTVREELDVAPELAGLPTLDLRPLDPAAARALVRSTAPACPAGVVEEIVGRGHANPLALVEHARAWPADRARSEESSLHRTWSAALDELPASTRLALAVVALAWSTARAPLEAVLADLGLGIDDLAAAARRRLVVVGDEDVALRHALLGPVVVATTTVGHRRRVLARLAARADEALAVWYLARDTTGRDDALADRLDGVAGQARRRSALLDAARALARAAELTVDPARCAARWLAAAVDAHHGGRCDLALAHADRARHLTSDPAAVAEAELVRARCHTWLGQPRRAVDEAVSAADAVRAHDPARAARLYAEAAVPCGMTGDVRRMSELAHVARELDEGADALGTAALVGHAEALAGRLGRARRALDDALPAAAAADPVRDAQALLVCAQALAFTERGDEARPLVDRTVETARREDAPLLLPFALLVRAELDLTAGWWASATADADEAHSWASELDQVANRAFAAVVLARLDAARGDSLRCRERVEESLALAGPHGVDCLPAYACAVLGADALARGDAETAATHLEQARRVVDDCAMANPVVVPLGGDLVEAWVRAGDRDRGHAALEWVAARDGTRWAEVVTARARGLLAEDADEAEEAFTRARIAAAATAVPFERARTLLCHGETLRRWRRPMLARAPLLEAVGRFATLGAAPWAERARVELAATGLREPLAPVPCGGLDDLTPQEYQVARSVSQGRNNTETAAALFVSRKTVESHLTRVYRKLGVRSRKELTAAFLPRS